MRRSFGLGTGRPKSPLLIAPLSAFNAACDLAALTHPTPDMNTSPPVPEADPTTRILPEKTLTLRNYGTPAAAPMATLAAAAMGGRVPNYMLRKSVPQTPTALSVETMQRLGAEAAREAAARRKAKALRMRRQFDLKRAEAEGWTLNDEGVIFAHIPGCDLAGEMHRDVTLLVLLAAELGSGYHKRAASIHGAALSVRPNRRVVQLLRSTYRWVVNQPSTEGLSHLEVLRQTIDTFTSAMREADAPQEESTTNPMEPDEQGQAG